MAQEDPRGPDAAIGRGRPAASSRLGPGKLTWPDRHGLTVCKWQCQRQKPDLAPDTGCDSESSQWHSEVLKPI